MATSAIGAELAVMHVVGTVAVGTATTEGELRLQRPSVAGLAGHVDVRTQQRAVFAEAVGVRVI